MDINQVNQLIAGEAVEEQEPDQVQEVDTEAEERIDELLEEDQEEQEEQDVVQQEEVEIQNLTQLADYLGLQAEESYGIEIPMPDGQEAMTISALKDEVIDRRREQASIEQAKQELQKQAQELEQRRLQPAPAFSDELLDIEATIRAIDAQFRATDWDNIENPGQAALYRQQLGDAKNQAVEKRNSLLQKQAQEQNTAYMNQAAIDWQETVKVIPEWSDGKVVQADKAKIKSDINDYGFRDEEIFMITDPRVIRMLRDFTLMKERLKKAEEGATEVRKRGIRVPNRQRQGISQGQKAALASKINKAKKTQDRRDIADAVTDLINQ
jgi:hypothetical protein